MNEYMSKYAGSLNEEIDKDMSNWLKKKYGCKGTLDCDCVLCGG